MSRGFPSMTALLGLLAIAGYQNRDKIGEMLGRLGQNKPGADGQHGLGGLLGQLGLGGASAGGILSGGLGELLERFKQSGQGDTAKSWVNTGPTSRARLPNWSGRLAPRCWTFYRRKQVYRETNSSRGFAANSPTQWISTLHKAISRRKQSFRAPNNVISSCSPYVMARGLSSCFKEAGNGYFMDDPHWLCRRRASEAHHSG